jgi:hypothetical protein
MENTDITNAVYYLPAVIVMKISEMDAGSREEAYTYQEMKTRNDFTSTKVCYAKKIVHLIQVGAYTTTNMPGGYRRGIPHREQVGQHLSTWMAGQTLGVGDSGFQLGRHITSMTKKNLLIRSSWRGLHPNLLEQSNPVEWATKNFQRLSVADGTCRIYDIQGECLGFRFRIPEPNNHLQRLNSSGDNLPLQPLTCLKKKGDSADPAQRGGHDQRHYALWTAYHKDMELQYSKEYVDQLPVSADWISTNEPLSQWIDDYIRLIFPEQWVKCHNPGFQKHLGLSTATGEAMKSLFAGYHGVCINRNMVDGESKPHKDTKDSHTVMNTVIPYGEGFSGGELIL